MKIRRRWKITDEEILQMVYEDIESDNAATSDYRVNRVKYFKMLMGQPEAPEIDTDRAADVSEETGAEFNTTLPLITLAINHIHPRIIDSIFNQSEKNFVRFSFTEKHDAETVRKCEEFLSYLLFNEVKDFFHFVDEGALIFLYEDQWISSKMWTSEYAVKRSQYGPFPELIDGVPLTIDDILSKIMGDERRLIMYTQKDEDYYEVVYEQHHNNIENPISTEKAYIDLFVDEFTRSVYAMVEEKVLTYEGVKCKNENLDYMFFPPDSGSLQAPDCAHVIVKYDKTLSQLRHMLDNNKLDITGEDFKLIEERYASDYSKESLATDGVTAENMTELGIDLYSNENRRLVHLADCYYSYDVNDDGYDEECLFTCVFDSDDTTQERPFMVIRKKFLDEEICTGIRPFDLTRFDLRPYSVFGRSLCDRLKPIQETSDDIWNQILNLGDLALNPFGFFDQTVGGPFKEGGKIKAKRGMFFPVENSKGIYIPQFPANIGVGAQQLQMLYSMFERLSSINDQVMGRQGGTKTATATVRLLGESMQNLSINYRRFAEGLKKITYNIYQLYRIYMPYRKKYRILGPDGKYVSCEITKEELIEHPDISLNIDLETTNKVFRREVYQMLFQSIAMNPILLQMGIVTKRNVYDAAKNFIEALDPKGADAWLTEPPDEPKSIPPEEENYLFMQGGTSMPKTREDHMTHIASHTMFRQSQMASAMPFDRLSSIDQHIKQHQQMMFEMQQMAAMAQQYVGNQQGVGMEQPSGMFFQGPNAEITGDLTSAAGRGQQAGNPGGRPI
jgi:hypothetical protein